ARSPACSTVIGPRPSRRWRSDALRAASCHPRPKGQTNREFAPTSADSWLTNAAHEMGQVRELLTAGTSIAGLDSVHCFHPLSERAFLNRYPSGGRRWVAGNTLCYLRSHWQRHRFADLDVGEDARFVWADASAGLRAHPETRFFVAVIHDANVA